jgi:hypothetical protein
MMMVDGKIVNAKRARDIKVGDRIYLEGGIHCVTLVEWGKIHQVAGADGLRIGFRINGREYVFEFMSPDQELRMPTLPYRITGAYDEVQTT